MRALPWRPRLRCRRQQQLGRRGEQQGLERRIRCEYREVGEGGVQRGQHRDRERVDKTGGVVKYGLSSTPDSFDPGNTYYAFVWDSSRLWARALTTFRPLPGKPGLQLVPDLATSLGKVSDGGKTYTYTLRSGLKFSDGSPITSADVKYAVERSNYSPDVLSNGPTYFNAVLANNTPAYKGPYKDKTGDLKSIQTPNATTIVFHLAKPFADFDYLTSNPQTAPVPKAKDTGADYVKHMISSGSYMFKSYDPNKGAVLVKNPNWDPKSDPIRKQYANEIDIAFNQEQTGIDQDLLAGNLTGDIAGAGVAASTQASIVNDPTKKANADDALSGTLAYLAMSTKVKPLDNVELPQGGRVRRRQGFGPERLGWPAAGGDRVDGAAAERGRLHQVRPVPDAEQRR